MHSNTIIKSLFLNREPSFLGLPEILHALNRVRSQDALDRIGREVIEIAHHARYSRDSELCSEASNLLKSLPLSRNLQWLTEYYSIPLQPSSPADLDETRQRLLRGLGDVETLYASRIVLKLGQTHDRWGDPQEALRYYAEAAKAATKTDALVTAQAALNIAIIRSDLGDHIGALREMNRLWPVIGLVCRIYPQLYYTHLNNLAVVLNRAGRIEESRRAIACALSSPLAHRFPEWRETEREIEEAATQEPRERAPTGKVLVAAARPERAAKKLPRPPRVFVVTIVGPVRTRNLLSLPHSTPHVVSLLERYVKTVRIRDSP